MRPVSPRERPSLLVEGLLLLAVAAFAAWFVHAHFANNRVHPPATIELLCSGEAKTPYQYRVLVPSLVQAVDAIGLTPLLGVTRLECALGIEAACVVALFYALRKLLANFLAGHRQPILWTAAGMYALPFIYVLPREWPYWYAWDLPAVLFTTLGVLWIHQRRWGWYYGVLPFATLNRETTALLIVIFALTQHGTMSRGRLVWHLLAQAAIWFVLRALLHHLYTGNPGMGQFWYGALRNSVKSLLDMNSVATLATLFGFLWLPFLFYARHVREPFVRRAILAVPLYFAACFAMAQLLELRIYGEVLPLIILGLACGVKGRLAQDKPGLPAASAAIP